ncbi:MAG: GNAT family N-acetyltransferase [Dehalococcoidia bacterium]
MPVTIQTVRLGGGQLAEAGEVLARAFYDDPLIEFVLPDEAHRTRALPGFMESGVRIGHVTGEVYTSAGAVEGAAVWRPPNAEDLTPEVLAAAGIPSAEDQIGASGAARFNAAMATLDALHKRDAPSAHWYLMILGVDPPRQGIGVGEQLIRPVLDRADAAGLPCYLETLKPRNVTFYRKHGFEVVVEDLLAGGPRYWTMRREPRR